ncbi:MAG TPA: phosphotransferase family protein [Acidimicrobiales bacterium]|nr:phosphotransferase family protein [Acidimicrobiales bacterium]
MSRPVGIDPGPIEAWFREHVPGARPPLRYERVAGGHSCLTYVVTDDGGERYVLRRPPLGTVLATAHDVAREHRVMAALQGTAVPVPRMRGLCEDTEVNGAPFFVMSYVDGLVVHTAGDTERLLPSHAARRRAAETLVDALVALHAVDVDAVGLGGFARRSGYLDRQLRRWSAQWTASKTRELPAMERLHAWLVEHRPAEPETCVVHGDIRLGNALHAPDGTTLALLDWELSTLGDPLADVSYLLRSWATPGEAAGGQGPPAAAAGFPSRDSLAERYAAASGRSLDDLAYWTALNAWRSAAISEGVYRRYIDGKMGDAPPDVERYARAVEITVQQGLVAAGMA